MTDSTHNTLVTVMIVIGVIIAIVLIGRGFGGGLAYRNYYYQPASAIDAYGYNDQYQTRYSDTVVSYSRPSRYTNFGTSTSYVDTTYTSYDTTYTYECSPDGTYCWTNQ